jgi:hypothetical protein
MAVMKEMRNGVNDGWTPRTKVRVWGNVDNRRTYRESMMRYFP